MPKRKIISTTIYLSSVDQVEAKSLHSHNQKLKCIILHIYRHETGHIYSYWHNLLSVKLRVSKESRAAGVLDNFAEGEKYAQHALRKYVRNKSPEIMPSINSFFADPKWSFQLVNILSLIHKSYWLWCIAILEPLDMLKNP